MLNARMEEKSFIVLLTLVSVAFVWLLLPFYSAVFWATILAILFRPMQRRLTDVMHGRGNLAALVSVVIILLMVILPVALLASMLVQEGRDLYERVSSGDMDLAGYFQQVVNALPDTLQNLLARFGLTDFSDVQQQLAQTGEQGGQFLASRMFSLGQDTFQFVISFFVMLYLLFFLLRDGPYLAEQVRRAIPLGEPYKQHLLARFTAVVRATVKGNVLVAIAQGTLGGIIFWILGLPGPLLWGAVMTVLSLLPAVGAGIIWAPVAIYYLATGEVGLALILTAYGVIVIGLTDNLLRPILVGKSVKLPDYVILIATIGGLVLFGINGFVIGPMIAALFISAWSLFAEARERQGFVVEQPVGEATKPHSHADHEGELVLTGEENGSKDP
jgi:predicted PurR-regulated permease PerM